MPRSCVSGGPVGLVGLVGVVVVVVFFGWPFFFLAWAALGWLVGCAPAPEGLNTFFLVF